MSDTLIFLCGVFALIVALFHLCFWRLFGWPNRLKGSGHLNAAITQVMNIMLIYVFATYGATLLWLGPLTPALLLAAGAWFIALRLGLQPGMFDVTNRGSQTLMLVGVAGLCIHVFAILG